MIVAIVPAAGKSERMGQPKLLLPLGSRRIIEHVLDELARAPIDRTFVVLAPGATPLAAIVEQYPRVTSMLLENQTSDMRSSVLAGLARVEADCPPQPHAFLVVLADQPTISAGVVRTIVERFQRNRPPIVVPTYRGKHGHPVLFAWSMVESIRKIPSDRGINWLVEQMRSELVLCPIDDASVLVDIDTPQDYDRAQREFGSTEQQ
jgi:molybdenum cofactor cytidylyltransferase